MSFRRIFLPLALCGSLFTHAAHANIVTNGGFETGGLEGWTQLGANTNLEVHGDFYQVVPHGGSKQAVFFNTGNAPGLTQTLDTVVGQTYLLSFWLGSSQPCFGSCWVDITWGNESVVASHDMGPTSYTQYTYELVATSSSTALRFFLQPSRYFMLDDVSVEAVTATTADVPEPATLALTLVALLGAGAAGRHRRAAA